MIPKANSIKFNNVGFVLFFLVLSSLTSCKKCNDPQNPDCDNYDPCYGKEQYSAKFLMKEGFSSTDGRVDYFFSDSVLLGYMVWFESEIEDPNVEHRWYVGSEVFEGRVTPGRRFDDPSIVRPTTIDITHVIEYEPNNSCNPNDDGYDSVTQTMYLIKYYSELQTFGKFYGAFEGSTDSFLVEIQALNQQGEAASIHDWYEHLFINFHNLGDSVYTFTQTGNRPFPKYGWVYMDVTNRNSRFHYDTKGIFEVFENNRFLMEYTVPLKLDSTGKTFVVEGRKIE